MILQWLRARGRYRDKIVGLALMFGPNRVSAIHDGGAKYWRLCDECKRREAMVFCRRHARYVCGGCLNRHSREGVCSFLSMLAQQLDRDAVGERA